MSFEIEAGVIAARITTLEGRADAQDIELAKIPAAIASAVDSATAPLIAQIALLESKVITLEAGVAALQAAASGLEEKAFKIIETNDDCDMPAFFSGWATVDGGRTPPNPYGIGCQFKIDDVTAGTVFLWGDTDAGTCMFEARCTTSGGLRIEVCSNAIGSDRSLIIFPSGTVESGVWYDLDIRSGAVVSRRRSAQARIGATYIADTDGAGSTGGTPGSMDKKIRLGNDRSLASGWNVTMKNVYATKGSPSDAQWNTINAASDRAARLAAIDAVAANSLLLSPTSDSDLTVGIVNAGVGGDATCVNMNDADNLVDAT